MLDQWGYEPGAFIVMAISPVPSSARLGKGIPRVMTMLRLVAATAMLLCSIVTSGAQQPNSEPSSQSSQLQTCVFAGENYSHGAEFCVTAHAGLRCDDGKWSRDTQLDCSEATDEHHRGQLEEDHMGHMMPDQDRSMSDHMMHQ